MDHEPTEGFDLLPVGNYEVAIVGSKFSPTKKGDGEKLELKLQVLNGPSQNRFLFDNINTKNPNPTCQKIGLGTVSAICRAVGVLNPKDTAELHDKGMLVSVGISRSEGYNDRNEIKSYKPLQAGGDAVPASTADATADMEAQAARAW